MDLSWTPASGATSYTVKRSLTTGTSYAELASGWTSTTYPDTAVSNGTTYYYVVSAMYDVTESANSPEVSATPSSPPFTAAEQSAPAINIVSDGAGGSDASVTVKSSVVGHTYQLQYVNDVTSGAWQNLGSSQAGTGGDIQIVVPIDPSSARGFYRIQIQR